MALQQTYYTSTENGLRASKGFQFQASSGGINDDILRRLEQLGNYVPPLSAPTRPKAEELSDFPITFLFQNAGDNRRAMIQSQYLGADYSGRFGNFFAHSLILPNRESIGSVHPIEFWKSPFWDSEESPSKTLPETELPTTAGVITPEAVRKF